MISLKPHPRTKTKTRIPLALGASLIAGFALLVPAVSAQASPPSQADGNSAQGIHELDVTNNPDRVNGQPQIAVDPTHPSDLVFISTSDDPAASTGPADIHIFQCFLAYSRNNGATWTHVDWPNGGADGCGNPQLTVDTHGVFYVIFNLLGGTAPANAGVVRSLDDGRTWSDPVPTPLTFSASPRLLVDTATDDLYAAAGGPGGILGPQAVSVSADHGLTWSPMTTALLPDQPFGHQIAVHAGILATATAQQVVIDPTSPFGVRIATTSPTLWVSTDNGQTWTARPVTDSNGQAVPAPSGALVPDIPTVNTNTDPIPWVAADPTQTGRFAVMVPSGSDLDVYITGDAGLTWTGPAVIAAPNAFKPGIAFGPTGLLGVVWRTTAVDAYSAISFNHGGSFSAPVQVNHTTEPAGTRIEGGDKYSSITMSGNNVYVTWSDGRTGGNIDGIMSRVPLSRYTNQ